MATFFYLVVSTEIQGDALEFYRVSLSWLLIYSFVQSLQTDVEDSTVVNTVLTVYNFIIFINKIYVDEITHLILRI